MRNVNILMQKLLNSAKLKENERVQVKNETLDDFSDSRGGLLQWASCSAPAVTSCSDLLQ